MTSRRDFFRANAPTTESLPTKTAQPDTAEMPVLREEADDIAGDALTWLTGIGLALAATIKPRSAQAQAQNDIGILNTLLTAEYGAIKAYDAGAGVLSNPGASDPLASAAPTVLAVAVHFQSQHRDHANQLIAKINAAGGTPVAESSVTFTPPSGFTGTVLNVIRLATNAEKDAAVAYTRVLADVNSETHAELIASIGGVESQHFIVLSLLAQGVVQATADTRTMAMEVVPRAFVTSPEQSIPSLSTVPDFTYA